MRIQAERRAAAASPSGILRTPPTTQQLVKGAQEELVNQQEIQNVKNLEAQKATEEQAALEAVGLAPKTQPEGGSFSPDEIVTNPSQARQTAALETPSMQQQPSTLATAQGLISQGIRQGEQAAGDYIAATDVAMTEFEKNQAALEQQKQQAMKEVEDKIRLTDEEEKKFKPDERSVWAKSSTGQKIALLIGGFLSSMNPQSAQAFRDTIQKNIDRDNELEAQELERIKSRGIAARSELDKLEQRFGSREAALLAKSNMKLNSIARRLEVTQQAANSKTVAANAMAGLEQVKSAITSNNLKIAELYMKQQGSSIEGFEGRALNDKEKAAAIEVKTARDKAKQAISQLTSNLSGAKVPLSEAKATFQKNRDILVFDLAKVLSGGKPSDVELAKAEEIVPSEWSPSAQKQLVALDKKIDQDFGIFMKNLGQQPIGSKIGRAK